MNCPPVNPDLISQHSKYQQYRLCYAGGEEYIRTNLHRINSRETIPDYNLRLQLAYSPNVARRELLRLQDALTRSVDAVQRVAPPQYHAFMEDVTCTGVGISSFIKDTIIPELLQVAGAYVFFDRIGSSDKCVLSLIKRESIQNMRFDSETGELTGVTFRAQKAIYDEETNFPKGTKEVMMLLWKNPEGYVNLVSDVGGKQETVTVYDVPSIPFVWAELPKCLLEDVIKNDVAILNLAASDLTYALNSNFAFFTEQVNSTDAVANGTVTSFEETPTGEYMEKTSPIVDIGVAHGRRYAQGLDRPGFINPSPDPLRVSMEKQSAIAAEIKELILRNLADFDTNREADGGLSCIAAKLAEFETKLLNVWNMFFQKNISDCFIQYPSGYTLLSTKEIQELVDGNTEQLKNTCSITMKKTLLKQNAELLLRSRVNDGTLTEVYKEIDAAEVIILDPNLIIKQHTEGIVGDVTATKLSGYSEDEAKRAQEDHMERLRRIALAQSPGNTEAILNGARGIDDMEPGQGGNTSATVEKKISQNENLNKEKRSKKTRGENR